MRVVRVHQPGGIDTLVIDEVPTPEPKAGEVLVRALAIGVGRPDVLIRKGTYKWMPPLPATPGAELVGVIEKLGSSVTEWELGERVLISARELPQRGGCYAQYICVNSEAPYRLPVSLNAEDALSLPNLQLSLALMQAAGVTGLRALEEAPLSRGYAPAQPNSALSAQSASAPSAQPAVLITGAAGGVATMLSQLAKHWGYRSFGTARSADKAGFALQFGFEQVFVTSAGELSPAVLSATQQRGVNIAFDHLGGEFLPACIRSLAPKGQAISYNIITGMPTENIFGMLRDLLGKSLSVQCFSMHTFDAERTVRRGLMEQAIALMAQGAVKAPPATRFALSEVRRAHDILDSGSTLGKIVLQP